MDGVVAMQPFYNEGGFEKAFVDKRFENTGRSIPIHSNISEILSSDLEAVLNYDRTCFGFGRPDFLRSWLNLPESRSFKFTEYDELKGYSVIRKVTKGYKIGPLFAEDHDIADELYKTCLNEAPGELIYLDVPMTNQEAVKLVIAHGAKDIYECARMYYNGDPGRADISKIYGITTFELG